MESTQGSQEQVQSYSHMTNQVKIELTSGQGTGERDQKWDSIMSPIGYILAVSYPVLALSTGVRSLFQLFIRDDIVNYFPVVMSGVAALCYLVATIGFAYRRRWTWWLSVVALGLETLMSFIIGIWSFIDPPFIGSTVWRHFGEDYGYFPLFQPLLGLAWLLWPQTLRAYAVRLQKPSRDSEISSPETSGQSETA